LLGGKRRRGERVCVIFGDVIGEGDHAGNGRINNMVNEVLEITDF